MATSEDTRQLGPAFLYDRSPARVRLVQVIDQQLCSINALPFKRYREVYIYRENNKQEGIHFFVYCSEGGESLTHCQYTNRGFTFGPWFCCTTSTLREVTRMLIHLRAYLGNNIINESPNWHPVQEEQGILVLKSNVRARSVTRARGIRSRRPA